MPLSSGQDALLLMAGLGAGIINGAAGGGTLVSFPALLAVGYPALTANVTSTVGIWTGYLGGSAGFRSELLGQKRRLAGLSPTIIGGSVLGGVLLLTTPTRDFRLVAPYLLVLACLLFTLQPYAASYFRRRGTATRANAALMHSGSFLGAVYGSYFGAGLGVVLLAVLASTIPEPLVRINGLRSVMALVINTVAVLIFVVHAHIAWRAAGLMAGSALMGGYVGARLARRIPTAALRAFVITVGMATAVDLFLS